MEKKYIKSTDVKKIVVTDRKEIEITYHPQRLEERNFWGTITQEYRPDGYMLFGWGTSGDFHTKDPEEYAAEYFKRLDTKIEYVNGKFYKPPYITIDYKPERMSSDVHYFETYYEALKAADRLAGLCNLIAIFKK